MEIFQKGNVNGLWKSCNYAILAVYAIKMLFTISYSVDVIVDGNNISYFIVEMIRTMTHAGAWCLISSVACLIVISMISGIYEAFLKYKNKNKNQIGFH